MVLENIVFLKQSADLFKDLEDIDTFFGAQSMHTFAHYK